MWAPVPETKEFRVFYDLETFPFEIKSDSEPKSGERLVGTLLFYCSIEHEFENVSKLVFICCYSAQPDLYVIFGQLN